MFYYKNWNDFCKKLSGSGLKLCTAEQSLNLQMGTRFVVLKHDVEDNIPKAYKLAAIEHKYGICGSYYVQAYLLNSDENVRLLKEMQCWGHEISYHYDVLDAHAGDYEAAEKDFIKKSILFADAGFLYGTICQHGNPVKNRVGYTSNRDFFRHPEIRGRYPQWVDMVVDYSKHAVSDYKYISDASYRWNIITEPETNDLHPEVKNTKVGGFDKLFSLIKGSKESFIVSTHPHRWMDKAWKIQTKIVVFRIVRNTVMIARYIPGVEWMLNKFYFLAKKI